MFQDATALSPTMQLITILVGILVLAVGRKLFWVVVGAVGFVIGLSLASEFLGGQPDWIILGVALLTGLVGAVLAILLQKVAIIIAGFLMGGYAALWLIQLFQLDLGLVMWLVAILGGIVGAMLAVFLFEAALIALSTVAGATLVVQVVNLDPLMSAILFVVLVIGGIIVQTQVWQQDTSEA
jgi:hypothetical protein